MPSFKRKDMSQFAFRSTECFNLDFVMIFIGLFVFQSLISDFLTSHVIVVTSG